MKKVYELKRMSGYHLVTVYMGVRVEAEFRGGNSFARMGGRCATNNPFVQDALEADDRFGKMYVLKETYDDGSERTQKSSVKSGKRGKTGGKKMPEKDAQSDGETEQDNTVKTFNDACDYFAERGEVCESEQDVEQMCEKYNVRFPNLNM